MGQLLTDRKGRYTNSEKENNHHSPRETRCPETVDERGSGHVALTPIAAEQCEKKTKDPTSRFTSSRFALSRNELEQITRRLEQNGQNCGDWNKLLVCCYLICC